MLFPSHGPITYCWSFCSSLFPLCSSFTGSDIDFSLESAAIRTTCWLLAKRKGCLEVGNGFAANIVPQLGCGYTQFDADFSHSEDCPSPAYSSPSQLDDVTGNHQCEHAKLVQLLVGVECCFSWHVPRQRQHVDDLGCLCIQFYRQISDVSIYLHLLSERGCMLGKVDAGTSPRPRPSHFTSSNGHCFYSY
jgi:hypothetical protein